MAGRRLDPVEAALWARVRATVRPLAGRGVAGDPVLTTEAPAMPIVRSNVPTTTAAKAPPVPPRAPSPHLDGGWDRRIARGMVQPDSMIDLHGHTLASAHALLDQRLAHAIARGDRVVLLVTGKPPRAESERPHARGAIRAAIDDWLLASRHADRIASIRGAHPRHGGMGALYVVLRRARGVPTKS